MRYLLLILALVGLPVQAATYQLGVDTVKPITCTNPTQRTDGTSLPASDIKEVRITVAGTGYTKTITMPGGCTRVDLDITTLSAGTYQMVGVTEDTGGRVSAVSPAVPFTLLAPIAPPKPPVILP